MNDRVLGGLRGGSVVWSEEFNRAAGLPVDPASWRPEVGGHGWGNHELQYYTDSTENAALDGSGNLAIVVRRPDRQQREGRFGGCEYTSARLITKDRVAFSYGLVRARIRLPRGRGVWPAFWMLGQNIDEVGWPQCGEIDVMENFGKDPAVVHGTVHGPGYAGAAGITASHEGRRQPGGRLPRDGEDHDGDGVQWQPLSLAERVERAPPGDRRDARAPRTG